MRTVSTPALAHAKLISSCSRASTEQTLRPCQCLQATRPSTAAGPPAQGAASSAAAGAGKASQPFWASWTKQLGDATTNFSKTSSDWWAKNTASAGKGFKMPKWEMPGELAVLWLQQSVQYAPAPASWLLSLGSIAQLRLIHPCAYEDEPYLHVHK